MPNREAVEGKGFNHPTPPNNPKEQLENLPLKGGRFPLVWGEGVRGREGC